MMSGQTPPDDRKPTDATTAGSTPFSHDAAGSDSATTAPADPVALQARIIELEGQIGDLTDRMLRAHAELDNVRKRTEREKADTAKYAVTKFATDMVAIADNLKRALAALPAEAQSGAVSAMIDGVRLTDQEMIKALERHGVRKVASLGQMFDPHVHQAVMQENDPSVVSGTIIKVFQEGFVIEDRTLRPAMVVMAQGGPKPAKPGEAASAAAPGSHNGARNSDGTSEPND